MKSVIANQTWSNFQWPDWVDEKCPDIKRQIMEFWSDSWNRGPAAWLENAEANHSPIIGDRVKVTYEFGTGFPTSAEGLFIFAWNNVGRILDDHGKVHYCGFHGFKVSRGGLWVEPGPDDYFKFDKNNFGKFYAREDTNA